ncbi:MAG: DUF4132 domain-containing protein [Phycisphaerales bacterium]
MAERRSNRAQDRVKGASTKPTESAFIAGADEEAVAIGRARFCELSAELGGAKWVALDLKKSKAGRKIAAARKDELVGVALGAMEDFGRVAGEIDPSVTTDAWNLHFKQGYRQSVAELLAWLFRMALPYSPEQFEAITRELARFPVLGRLGCPHFGSFVGALERFAERTGVAPELADLLTSIERAYRASGRAEEGRFAARVAAILKSYAAAPAAEPPPPSRLQELLLRHESPSAAITASMAQRVIEALVLPAETDHDGAAAVPPDTLPELAGALGAINSLLAAMGPTRRYSEVDERDVQSYVDAVSAHGFRGAALAASVLAAMSQRPIKADFDNPRAQRFDRGVHAALILLGIMMETTEGSDPASLGELADALSRVKDFEYVHADWIVLARHISTQARPLLESTTPEGVLVRVLRFRERLARASDSATRGAVIGLDEALGIGGGFPVDLGERWSDRMYTDLRAMPARRRTTWLSLLETCAAASGSQPSAKWLARAHEAAARMPGAEIEKNLGTWFGLVGKSRPAMPEGRIEGRDSSVPSERAADVLRGLAWAAAGFDTPGIARALGDLAMACFKMVPGVGARCIKPGMSSVWALSKMRGVHALAQLSRVRQLVKFGTAKKTLDLTLARLARDLGVATDELHEVAAPDFGLDAEGTLREEAGEFTLELRVNEDGAGVRVLNSSGAERKSIPEAVKKNNAETLKTFKTTAADIEKILPAQKSRLERLYHEGREWPVAVWRQRYLEHPLVGTLARRLIWSFTDGGASREGVVHDGTLVDERGRVFDVVDSQRVHLWHPIECDGDRVRAWRAFLEDRRVRQPFKQAHREVYLLTDAERATGTYSNRFAAHIIRQNQLVPLCQQRGWVLKMFVLEYGEPPTLDLPRYGLRATFEVQATGEDYYGSAGAFSYLETDRVRFDRAGGGDPVSLENVPALAFTEVMRDMDLFVALCSVGNNPEWHDGGPDRAYRDYWWAYSFGNLSESGAGRKDLLERLIPRLAIASACSFDGKFLVVKGKLRTYKIHLGSGNILMEPNDQYLCIVPTSRGDVGGVTGGSVFLPFEGDRTLSIILSKAIMLADDDRIKDSSITRQITGR